MRYSISAVCLTLGTSLLTVGPGLSAFIMCILCAPLNGKNAIMNTRTPIPPTQCVKQRHILMDFGRFSTVENIVEPVVENPDADSKSASIYVSVTPENINGSAPKVLNAIQQSETITKPSLA